MSTWLDAQQNWLQRASVWLPAKVQSLRLRCWLSSPIGWDYYMPLTVEGVLQFVVVWAMTDQSPDCVFAECPNDLRVEIPIPIADIQIGPHAIACASAALPAPLFAEDVRYRRKRADVDSYNANKVVTSGGWAKSLNIACPTVVTPFVGFFVRGDRDKLTQLLTHPSLAGIGRDIGRGLGTVLGWEIDHDPADRSLVFNGAPQRVLPYMTNGPFAASTFAPSTWSKRNANLRAPYWKGCHQQLCIVPTPWSAT